MADKSFGVKELNLLNASGTPTVTSPNNLNLNANTVAISTSCTIGSNLTVSGNIDVDGTTNLDNVDIVGITTIRNASGTKLYEGSANGSKLFHAGTERLSTETYGIDINGTLGADQINCSGVSTITVPANTNPHSSWDVVNNSASSYRFTGPGQDGAEDNPDIYLVRGQRYLFKMNASGHPFQIRVANGGAAYSDGVTNNGAQTGNVVFNVQHDAPAQLYYQCTSHGGMVGNIYIVGGPQVISGVVTATTFSGNLTGTTGTFSGNLNVAQNIVHINDTDTKIEFLTNTINFDTAGGERLRINSSGAFGLGGANYGTSGQVLTSGGSGSAVQWASPVVAGSILQTVYNSTTSEGQTSSSSFQNWSGLATNITPLSSSSHLWIWINAIRLIVQQDGNEGRLRITDGSNNTEIYRCVNYDSDGNYLSFNPCLNWYWPQTHTAGTQITLTPQLRNTNGSGNIIWGDNGDESYMIVQEIAR